MFAHACVAHITGKHETIHQIVFTLFRLLRAAWAIRLHRTAYLLMSERYWAANAAAAAASYQFNPFFGNQSQLVDRPDGCGLSGGVAAESE